jgi:hypothetical protein
MTRWCDRSGNPVHDRFADAGMALAQAKGFDGFRRSFRKQGCMLPAGLSLILIALVGLALVFLFRTSLQAQQPAAPAAA